MNQKLMPRAGAVAALLLAAGLQTACTLGVIEHSFDRKLSVDGPVRIEVVTGSGKIIVRAGVSGQVRIHGDVRASGLIPMSEGRQVKEIAENPPIKQIGNVIRIGKKSQSESMVYGGIAYTIETPADTQLDARNGSGGIEVSAIHGPVKLSSGSGSLQADKIGDDVTIHTGSGVCRVSRVAGRLTFSLGSGTLQAEEIAQEVRGNCGSGQVTLQNVGGRVGIETSSGNLKVSGAKADLRASTSSGRLQVSGSPAPRTYWELSSSSGAVDLAAPQGASFLLHARTDSGMLETMLPITIEEQSKRELRARVGASEARVDIRTASGSIRIH
jgi:DUF4097 and DUF4098 domain-containing protein YvlB